MAKLKPLIEQVGLVAAVGFVLGHTFSDFISAIVNDALMPLAEAVFLIDDWQNDTITLGNFSLKWGMIAKDLIRLIIVATMALLILRFIQKEDE